MKRLLFIFFLATVIYGQRADRQDYRNWTSSATGETTYSGDLTLTGTTSVGTMTTDTLNITSFGTLIPESVLDTTDALVGDRVKIGVGTDGKKISTYESEATVVLDKRFLHWKDDLRGAYFSDTYTNDANIVVLADSYGDQILRLKNYIEDRWGDAGFGYLALAEQTVASGGRADVILDDWTASTDFTDTMAVHSQYVQNNDATGSVKIVLGNYGDQYNEVMFHYRDTTGAGMFSYQVNYDGTIDTVDTDGALSVKFLRDALGTDYTSADTLYINSVSGTVRIYGVSFVYNKSYGKNANTRIHQLSKGGATYQNFSTQNYEVLDSLDASLVIINFLEETANLEYLPALIAKIQAQKSDLDIMAVIPSDVSDNRAYSQRTRIVKIADSMGVATYDMYNQFGTYSEGNALSLYTDGSHLNGTGYHHIAMLLYEHLFLRSIPFSTYTVEDLTIQKGSTKMTLTASGTGHHYLTNVSGTATEIAKISMLNNGRLVLQANQNMPFTVNNDGSGTDKFEFYNSSNLLLRMEATNPALFNYGIDLAASKHVEAADSTGGVILLDSAGIRWKIKVNTAGSISADSTGLN